VMKMSMYLRSEFSKIEIILSSMLTTDCQLFKCPSYLNFLLKFH